MAWGTSWGFDEGQARFFENFVGRSLPFWKYIFPMAQERFPLLKNTTAEEFYQNLHAVNCGPLRLYADELTYNLHIILRYELEKLYYDGKADVDELPELWNDKYEEYLATGQERCRGYFAGCALVQRLDWLLSVLCAGQLL